MWIITVVISSLSTFALGVWIGTNIKNYPKPITCEFKSNSSDLSSRFSCGEKTIFPNKKNNPKRQKGITAFNQGDYQKAENLFSKFLESNPNDPEIKIYLNNARAIIAGNPFQIAVVVPANRAKLDPIAEELLRGVAHSQELFNNTPNNLLGGRLLEIVIVKDSDNPKIAVQLAEKLAKNTNILAVIGHYSSEATKAALEVYEKYKLPVISPTSSSTTLSSPVFFRTVVSNDVLGRKLAEYVKSIGSKKVAIFYNHEAIYSRNMQDQFTKFFNNSSDYKNIDMTKANWNANNEVKALKNYDTIVLITNVSSTEKAIKVAKANNKLLPEQKMTLLGSSALYNSSTLNEGAAVEGLILIVPWYHDTPYAEQAKQIWKGNISYRTAGSYDATQALIDALTPNADRSSILYKLKETNLPAAKTSGNPLSFNVNGNRNGKAFLVKVVNGKFQRIP